MQGFNMMGLMDEIKSLSSIADFGGLRLQELSRRIEKHQLILNQANTHNALSECMNHLKQFQSSIHASEQAIINWKEKVEGYFYQVHEYAKTADGQEQSNLLNLSQTMTDLMKTFSAQLSLVLQLLDKTKQLLLSAERKQKSMVTTFERGRAPILNITDDDDWVMEI